MKITIRIPTPKPTKWHTNKKGNRLYNRKTKHKGRKQCSKV